MNIGECWGGNDKFVVMVMIMFMGDICIRGCRFCSVKINRKFLLFDLYELENMVEVLVRWGLGYVVLISVDCDDLVDGGVRYFVEMIRRIK